MSKSPPVATAPEPNGSPRRRVTRPAGPENAVAPITLPPFAIPGLPPRADAGPLCPLCGAAMKRCETELERNHPFVKRVLVEFACMVAGCKGHVRQVEKRRRR